MTTKSDRQSVLIKNLWELSTLGSVKTNRFFTFIGQSFSQKVKTRTYLPHNGLHIHNQNQAKILTIIT